MITINEKYMQRCIQIARNGAGYTAPNPMVGAVLVDKDGLIIGEGFHRCCGGPHAEVNAITAVKDESLLKKCNAICQFRAMFTLREDTAMRRIYYTQANSTRRSWMP